MLDSLEVKNFTAFSNAELRFAGGLNVIVGENGLSKTHLLKLPYAVMAVSAKEGEGSNVEQPTKARLQTRLAEKLVSVFRPEGLGRLARRQRGRNRCEVELRFSAHETSVGFSFATQNRSEVVVDRLPSRWCDQAPVFLPTRELMTIYPGFVSLYETHHLEFDETWRDTCLLLGSPTVRGPREKTAAELLEPLEKQIGGRVVLEEGSGRFYLRQPRAGNMEMPLVAEGWRKLGMLARLIATGSLLDTGCLFWDEPESNLNPKLIREVARTILRLCQTGIQVFVATHSLFLLREFEVLLHREFAAVEQRCFALRRGSDGDGVEVSQADQIGDADPLILLDEDLEQSDRFIEEFQG